jgi:hypothetical protein
LLLLLKCANKDDTYRIAQQSEKEKEEEKKKLKSSQQKVRRSENEAIKGKRIKEENSFSCCSLFY